MKGQAGWVWLLLGLAIVGAISVLSVGSSSTPAPLAADSAQPDGALALSLWLQQSGYRTEVDNGAGTSTPSKTTEMILTPGSGPSGRAITDLMARVRAGERLVIANDGMPDNGLLLSLGIRPVSVYPTPVRVVQPLLTAPTVTHLSGYAVAALPDGGIGIAIAVTSSGAALLLRRVGSGQIWVLTAPEMLDNQHIARAGNRRLALNLAGAPGRTVAFDEEGVPATVASGSGWLTGSAWGIALLFTLLVLILYRGLSGWRLGPALAPAESAQRAASEYVVSLAGLLRRAGSRAEVLRLYQEQLQRSLVERYGPEGQEPTEVLEQQGDLNPRQRAAELLTPVKRLSEGALVARATAIVKSEEEIRRTRG